MRRDEAFLLDMLIAARDAVNFASKLARDEFRESRLHQQAIAKALETVGEAAARVSEETRKASPDIPWRDVIGMRNRLVHGYFDLDLDKVWETVQSDLSPLIAALEPLVPPE